MANSRLSMIFLKFGRLLMTFLKLSLKIKMLSTKFHGGTERDDNHDILASSVHQTKKKKKRQTPFTPEKAQKAETHKPSRPLSDISASPTSSIPSSQLPSTILLDSTDQTPQRTKSPQQGAPWSRRRRRGRPSRRSCSSSTTSPPSLPPTTTRLRRRRTSAATASSRPASIPLG